MPLILEKDLINDQVLKQENIFTLTEEEAEKQDIRPVKIAIVNLMPTKEATELQLIRMLSNTSLQIKIDLIKTASYSCKNSDETRLNKYYKTYDDIKNDKYDGMIITGAPVEKLDYNDILYWDELKKIFKYARKNVYSTLFICWAAQAALHYFYDIDSTLHKDKIFGVFEFQKDNSSKLLKGFDDSFYIPQSRYTSIDINNINKCNKLETIIGNAEIGLSLATSKDNRFVFTLGHWEYDRCTLHNEYLRDLSSNLSTNLPKNYYINDNIDNGINVKWRSSANLFFTNWLNYFVYQETPYVIDNIVEANI